MTSVSFSGPLLFDNISTTITPFIARLQSVRVAHPVFPLTSVPSSLWTLAFDIRRFKRQAFWLAPPNSLIMIPLNSVAWLGVHGFIKSGIFRRVKLFFYVDMGYMRYGIHDCFE